MKKHCSLFLLPIICMSVLNGMEQGLAKQGPMNSKSFYDQKNPFYPANKLHQDCQWKDAEDTYRTLLKAGFGTTHDKNLARVSRAACKWAAQRKASEGWGCFDALIDIKQEERISKEMIEHSDVLRSKLILVRTDYVEIDDIFMSLEAANILQKRTGCYVILSVRDNLKETLRSTANAYDFGLVDERYDTLPKTDYTTHLISLLGHLKLDPASVAPERVMLTAPERAMVAVAHQIRPLLAQGKIVAMVNAGEVRPATLIGGKELPHNPQAHARHLSPEAFRMLLANHPELVLLDCGTQNGRVAVGENQKHQYMLIAQEEQAFDTPIALALLMDGIKNIIGFGADADVTNVFIRALTKAAQRRMALIVPNRKEYDMRMAGKGKVYQQMISDCMVYTCDTPQDQIEMIERAYHDMISESLGLYPL